LENKLDGYVVSYKETFSYELDNRLILNWYPKRVVNKMKPGSLLELGVGHGYSCRQFDSKVSKYTILDGSKAVIKQFRENNTDLKHISIIETYFEDYSSNLTYDNIVMGFVLEHVEDPELILKKYKSMLSCDGKLFISVPNASSLHRQLANLAGMLPNIEALSQSDHELGHVRYFTVDTLKELVERCGYQVLSIEGLFLKPFTTSQITSLNLSDSLFEALMQKGIEYPELSTGILLEAKAL
jgi:2-polyprenyl-3-methyl-5-hydroxy-6-metoxy-1,4-benzoquinol methylase